MYLTINVLEQNGRPSGKSSILARYMVLVSINSSSLDKSIAQIIIFALTENDSPENSNRKSLQFQLAPNGQSFATARTVASNLSACSTLPSLKGTAPHLPSPSPPPPPNPSNKPEPHYICTRLCLLKIGV